ncbi:DUF4365 domain-containing protein [Hymenobacter rubidus]|uniref:DUF4365 domain-containing protein n=1 Tax=Hymenobacter rubidus TaxID=1441626 RepID=UPI0019202C6C|nr:DUF4365 domain-containing protein [Hymenobacter rubidus]
MSKALMPQHIIGERGVVEFARYCNRHIPYIIFRETTKSDFGIDGEVELVVKNAEGQLQPTGELIKVQLKSTNSAHSYMGRETDDSFEFHARQDDMEYWLAHENKVLLVVYDARTDVLYCKQITSIDAGTARKKYPILFDKVANRLEIDQNDFLTRFSASVRTRVNFDASEMLTSNLFKLQPAPKSLYSHRANYTSKKEVYDLLKQDEVPPFHVENGIVYTFQDIDLPAWSLFKEKVVEEALTTYNRHQYMRGPLLRKIAVQLLNVHIKDFMWDNKLRYNKDYKRFYFPKPREGDKLVVQYTTRNGQPETRTVVANYTYGKYSFYRHFAFEYDWLFDEQEIYLVLQPKYLFTSDGTKTLPPDRITKLTNYLTAREFNSTFLNHIHFIQSYLFKNHNSLTVSRKPDPEIVFWPYSRFKAGFSIPEDSKAVAKAATVLAPIPEQLKLL